MGTPTTNVQIMSVAIMTLIKNICTLADEVATVQAGMALAGYLQGCETFFLQGDLGVGKTTFVRGVLQGLGHKGTVKSPTYTLVEPYQLPNGQRLCHFDLYRLGDPEELEFIGIRDYFDGNGMNFIEWPEKGERILPEPDGIIKIEVDGRQRRLSFSAKSVQGEKIAAQWF